eukprot:scaffold70944_cov60-Phaeocystis_antarctica.AAC.4
MGMHGVCVLPCACDAEDTIRNGRPVRGHHARVPDDGRAGVLRTAHRGAGRAGRPVLARVLRPRLLHVQRRMGHDVGIAGTHPC